MKPTLLKVPNEAIHSFTARQDNLPNINNRWHYHPEIELIHFHKGAGTQFVGDHIKRFGPDDIVLVGSNLPHYWKYDETQTGCDNNTEPYSTVIHFFQDFWSERFLNLPENKVIKTTLDNARRGIQIIGNNQSEIAGLMSQIVNAEGPRRIILLMEVLMKISACTGAKPLASMGFRYNFDESDNDRINLICDYSFANFKNKVLLEEIAGIANLSRNSFCRYFKSKTQKTYSQFINEIRIGNACKLLIADKISIKQICYECGFNNFSSFHAAFKLKTGKTPLNYKQEYLSKRIK